MTKKSASWMALFFALILLTSCGFGGPKPQSGTYVGEGRGYSKEDPIRISVTIDESGAIYDLKILSHKETEKIGGKALDDLVQAAKEKNSADLDTVSGATRTSEGFRQALEAALQEAKEGKGDSEEKK